VVGFFISGGNFPQLWVAAALGTRPQGMTKTLTIHAGNRPDFLARVVLLFHRRAIRIHSLHMDPDERPEVLKITIVAEASEDQSVRLAADLYKLVNVLSVETAAHELSAAR
jgi:acetolactate synthase-1/3 small subunit